MLKIIVLTLTWGHFVASGGSREVPEGPGGSPGGPRGSLETLYNFGAIYGRLVDPKMGKIVSDLGSSWEPSSQNEEKSCEKTHFLSENHVLSIKPMKFEGPSPKHLFLCSGMQRANATLGPSNVAFP